MAASSMSSPLLRRGLYLEYLTLGWNVVGAVVIIVAAAKARSVALAGFGLDSLIEIVASVVVVWQLKDIGHDRERTALRLIGGAFFALALYVLAQAGYTLLTRAHPGHSPGGIAWLAATLVAMLLLAYGKLVQRAVNGSVVSRVV
jgi:divalent metal cation (Fe/Co/Zn/Cd) transporter